MRLILILTALLAFQSAAASKYEELLIRANTGNAVSQYELAEHIASSKVDVKTNRPAENSNSNWAEAIIWYRKSAEQGHLDAQYGLAKSLLDTNASSSGSNLTEALQWLTQASGKNHAAAQVALANLYKEGIRIPVNGAEATRLYISAADLGNVEAQYRVAWLFENLGNSKYKDSIAWYEKAANSSQPTINEEYWQGVSRFRLGEIYQAGKMDKKDLVKAFSWYELAAQHRNSYAMVKLAAMYEKGLGIKRDLPKALMWYMIASSRGLSKSRKKVSRLSKKFPSAEIQTISMLASECRGKGFKNC
jgi:TPR repeat protein